MSDPLSDSLEGQMEALHAPKEGEKKEKDPDAPLPKDKDKDKDKEADSTSSPSSPTPQVPSKAMLKEVEPEPEEKKSLTGNGANGHGNETQKGSNGANKAHSTPVEEVQEVKDVKDVKDPQEEKKMEEETEAKEGPARTSSIEEPEKEPEKEKEEAKEPESKEEDKGTKEDKDPKEAVEKAALVEKEEDKKEEEGKEEKEPQQEKEAKKEEGGLFESLLTEKKDSKDKEEDKKEKEEDKKKEEGGLFDSLLTDKKDDEDSKEKEEEKKVEGEGEPKASVSTFDTLFSGEKCEPSKETSSATEEGKEAKDGDSPSKADVSIDDDPTMDMDTAEGDVEITPADTAEEAQKKQEEGDGIIFLAEKKKREVPDDDAYFAACCKDELDLYAEVLPRKAASPTCPMQCTACWKQITGSGGGAHLQRHPVLGVPVCSACFHFYHCGDWTRDEEGLDMFCRWCANGGDLLLCDKCPNAFCKRCIQRNLGRKFLSEIQSAEEWSCLVCDPKPLMPLRATYHAFYKQKRTGRKVEPASAATPKREPKAKKESNGGAAAATPVSVAATPKGLATSTADNIIDKNLNFAFQALAHLQKGLVDERRRWARVAEKDNQNSNVNATKTLRRLFAVTKLNMELLDTKIVKSFDNEFDDTDLVKIGKINNSSPGVPEKLRNLTLPKAKPTASGGSASTPARRAPIKIKRPAPKKKAAAKKKPARKPAGRAHINGRSVTAEFLDTSEEEEEEEAPPPKRRPGPASKTNKPAISISLFGSGGGGKKRPAPKSRAAARPGPKSKKRRIEMVDLSD